LTSVIMISCTLIRFCCHELQVDEHLVGAVCAASQKNAAILHLHDVLSQYFISRPRWEWACDVEITDSFTATVCTSVTL